MIYRLTRAIVKHTDAIQYSFDYVLFFVYEHSRILSVFQSVSFMIFSINER
jgi:hypothetical protein